MVSIPPKKVPKKVPGTWKSTWKTGAKTGARRGDCKTGAKTGARKRDCDCWDNAMAESFLGTIKTELIDRRPGPRVPGTWSWSGISVSGTWSRQS